LRDALIKARHYPLAACPSGSGDAARRRPMGVRTGGGTGVRVTKPVPKGMCCRGGERRPTGELAGDFVGSGGEGIPTACGSGLE
jgi:hypothetical protein